MCKFCTHFRSLNVLHFGMMKDQNLNNDVEITFNAMTSLLNFMNLC
jgi:hypothetical protein